MSNEIKIVEREEIKTLEMQAECNMFAMPATFGRIYKTIADYMEESKIECTLPPYANYIEVNWDEFNKTHPFIMFFKMLFRKWKFIAGFPAQGDLKASGDIAVGALAKGKYVEALHKGPYQKVGQTYKKMCEYIRENNIEVKDQSIEIYLNDPCQTKASDLETTVLIPLVD